MRSYLPRLFDSPRGPQPVRPAAARRALRMSASGIAFVALITGCSNLHSAPTGASPGGRKPSDCGESACPAVATQIIGNRCTVSVGVDPVKVPAGTVVSWELAQIAADPIVFTATGIVIDDPNHDFVDNKISTDGTTYTWTANATSSKKSLKYSVNAVWMRAGTDGILCKVLDPIIVNEG